MITMSIAGVSSANVGLYVKTHRSVIAEATPNILEVSGRDGFYDFGDNTYKARYTDVDFFLQDKSFPDLWDHVRKVAAWLARKGEIRFSDEPDKYYIGRTYSAPVLEQKLTPSGRFSATFLTQPFAYGPSQSDEASGVGSVHVPINYPGTTPSCCLIIIRNDGDTPISNIQITHTYRR